jgi:endonuclease G, mitochondrial
VVPQSWFNMTEPMRGDRHHLFACEARSRQQPRTPNSPTSRRYSSEQSAPIAARANATVSSQPWQGRRGSCRLLLPCSLTEAINVTELPRDRLGVLLAWHEQDPMSEWERHRNAAIFGRQGNRNPFIDHHEWAAEVISQLD